MDPNATLKEFRDAVKDADEAFDNTMERDDALEAAMSAAQDLDVWLSTGGFPPSAWPIGRNLNTLRARLQETYVEDETHIFGRRGATQNRYAALLEAYAIMSGQDEEAVHEDVHEAWVNAS